MGNAPSSGLPGPFLESFVTSGRINARHALSLYSAGDLSDGLELQIAMAAGSAVESLMKAGLAMLVPALLAERGDPHSILLLSGKQGMPGKSYLDCRMISAQDAKKTLIGLFPSINAVSLDIDKVLACRNTAAHLNMLAEAEVADAVRALAVSVDTLAPVLQFELSDFWGETLRDYALALVQKAMDEKRLLLEQLEVAARERLERMRELDPQVLELWAVERSAPPEATEDDEDGYREAHQCPVCEWWGWLYGSETRGSVHEEDLDHGVEYWVMREWASELFECGVCGLRLDGRTLRVAGFQVWSEIGPTKANEQEIFDYDTDKYTAMDEIADRWVHR